MPNAFASMLQIYHEPGLSSFREEFETHGKQAESMHSTLYARRRRENARLRNTKMQTKKLIL